MAAQTQELNIQRLGQLENAFDVIPERFGYSEQRRFDFVEKELINIFEEEEKQKKPVFLFIKKGTIQKIAYHICNLSDTKPSIGIAGESASGKSTIAIDIINEIQNFADEHGIDNMITRLNTDDYYYDRSKEVKKAGGMANFAKNYDFDVPEAIELDLMNKHIEQLSRGIPTWLPKYDMSGTTIRIDKHTYAHPGKIIIAEGLFTLTPKIKNAFNFRIYVDVSQDVQKMRWYKRAEERGLGNAADKIYQNACDKARIYVKPTVQYSDIVLNGEADRERYKIFTRKILSVVEDSMLAAC